MTTRRTFTTTTTLAALVGIAPAPLGDASIHPSVPRDTPYARGDASLVGSAPALPLPPHGPDATLVLLEVVAELIGAYAVLDDFLTERLKERYGIQKEHLGARDDRDDGITTRQRDLWEWEDHRVALGRLFRTHGLLELLAGVRRPRGHDELPPAAAWAKDRVGALHEYVCADSEEWRTGSDPICR